MSFGRGIAEAVALGAAMAGTVTFLGGVFVGWLVFWALPTAWPSIKQWLHALSA